MDGPAASQFPRVALGQWPTALDRCERLSSEVGFDIWLKRDDCSGLAIGGNKTRKLEFLLGRAIADGADTALTFGALQSNHARQTAAACAKLGMQCELVLTRMVDRTDAHYATSGNLLLDGLFGARLHVVDSTEEAIAAITEIDESVRRDGRTLFTIPPGGSDATGALGYVVAGSEIAVQAAAKGIEIGRIVVAASTAGTAAGLVLGATLADLDAVVDVVCVYHDAAQTGGELKDLVAAGAALLGMDEPGSDRWTVTDDELGDGYGVPTRACLDAIALLARTEGVLLDPVYTGKAFASMLARPSSDDRAVVFVHTGGSPGLFAYAPVIEKLIKETSDG